MTSFMGDDANEMTYKLSAETLEELRRTQDYEQEALIHIGRYNASYFGSNSSESCDSPVVAAGAGTPDAMATDGDAMSVDEDEDMVIIKQTHQLSLEEEEKARNRQLALHLKAMASPWDRIQRRQARSRCTSLRTAYSVGVDRRAKKQLLQGPYAPVQSNEHYDYIGVGSWLADQTPE